MRPEDRRYFVRASIRRMGMLHWNEELRRVFGILSAATSGPSSRVLFYGDLRRQLLDALSVDTPSEHNQSYVDAYLAALREFRMMVPETPRGRVRISPDDIDSEYLVSGLFGVSSGIPGLDQLFGGCGPILPDFFPWADEGSRGVSRATCLNARTILVRGPAGSGKSLLACHLAASVAGKGGIATIVSAEQGPEEYLYTLRTMGLSSATAGFQLAFSQEERARLQCEATPGGGAIVYAGVDRELLEEGFPNMETLANRMSAYPLRLLIIDSLNGIANMARARDIDLRGTLAAAFRGITAKGVNLLIIEEEQGATDLRFEEQQNLADTVLRLQSKNELTYQKRFIQILKLRFQREQRGEHPFSIVSGSGIHVVPSPVAVRTRVSRRRARGAGVGPDPIGLGIGALDAIAGTPVRPGHIVLVEGVAGARKSMIASAFLLANQGKPNAGASVLLSIGETTVGAWPSVPIDDVATDAPGPLPTTPFVRSVPRGFASPGTMFQRLDDIFDAGLTLGKPTHRLAIDDLASLDVDAPLVAADHTFGHILCDYLRRQDAISLLVSRTVADGEHDLVRRAVAANADFHFLLTHRRGERHGHVLLTVVKSPGMRHRTGWFDVSVDETSVDIAGTPTLVDLDRNGDERRLRVVLFMFADAPPHDAYNQRVAAALQSNPNLDVELAPQTPVVGPGAFSFRGRSGYRDIRIVQLDEFQVPKRTEAPAGLELFHFEADDVPTAAASLPQVGERTKVSTRDSEPGARGSPTTRRDLRRAVPYYCNIGFLVLRDKTAAIVTKLLDDIEPDQLKFSAIEKSHWRKLADRVRREADPGKIVTWLDWQALALLSEVFELRRRSGKLDEMTELPGAAEDFVFFDHTGWTEENYNVLFLEILLWVRSGHKLPRDNPSLEAWLLHPTAQTAIKIFWRLLRPAYEREERARPARDKHGHADNPVPGEGGQSGAVEGGGEGAHVIKNVRDRALVWRQWFTTLAELFTHLNRDEARGLSIQPLPRDCGVAGDWYLGVLADSALPMGALHIIRTLTTAEAELERLRHGMGLPTQLKYYDPTEPRRRSKQDERGRDPAATDVAVSDADADSDEAAGELNDEAVGKASFTSVSSRLTLPMHKKRLRKLVEGAFRRSELSGYSRKASTLFAALRRVLEFQPGTADSHVADTFLQSLVVELVEQLGFIERSSRSVPLP